MAKKAAPKSAEHKGSTATDDKAGTKPATKTEFYASLAEKTGLSKKQVSSVFDAFFELHGKELGKKGPGILTVPGLYKIKVVHKPATKARPGFNPATKQPIMIKAKPARKVIKVQPLKALKDLI
jgi:nucleoid DNA-binding protein